MISCSTNASFQAMIIFFFFQIRRLMNFLIVIWFWHPIMELETLTFDLCHQLVEIMSNHRLAPTQTSWRRFRMLQLRSVVVVRAKTFQSRNHRCRKISTISTHFKWILDTCHLHQEHYWLTYIHVSRRKKMKTKIQAKADVIL